MTTEEFLYARYSGAVLLSIDQLAEVFHRSKNGLRITLNTDNELSRKLLPCKVKMGRRIYFRTSEVAKIIDEG